MAQARGGKLPSHLRLCGVTLVVVFEKLLSSPLKNPSLFERLARTSRYVASSGLGGQSPRAPSADLALIGETSRECLPSSVSETGKNGDLRLGVGGNTGFGSSAGEDGMLGMGLAERDDLLSENPAARRMMESQDCLLPRRITPLQPRTEPKCLSFPSALFSLSCFQTMSESPGSELVSVARVSVARKSLCMSLLFEARSSLPMAIREEKALL